MRIPLPDRFAIKHLILFCVLMFLGQMFTGTDIFFALSTTAFIVFAAVGYNVSGGMLYPSGSFIFFNAVLTAIFGLTYKVFLGEPGQNSLQNGDKSMLVYAAGMFAMMCAGALSARLRPKRGLLADVVLGEAMKRAAVGCLIFGLVLSVVTAKSGDGTLGSAFRQLNNFIRMSILLATTYEFRRSGGRRATNWIVITAIVSQTAIGAVAFTKEGMFLGPVTWILAAAVLGYNFRIWQLVVVASVAFFGVYYLVPYSQYVRNFSSESGSRTENLAISLSYLGDLNRTRALYLENMAQQDTTGEPHLFSKPQGFTDRLNMLAFDDALTKYTDEGNVFGLTPTFYSYANVLPHFIWKDKPHFAFGNVYGRSLGVIAADDDTTGISFSPTGDAYHQAEWFGVLIVWPLVAFLFFFANDSLTGSARHAPWALMVISQAPHAAPEGMLAGMILLTTYGIASLLIIVGFAGYLLPILTSIVSRSGGTGTPGLAAGPTTLPASRA